MNKIYQCPLHHTMNLIGSKWKPLILYHLLDGPLRSGILQSKICEISNKMFTKNVRELERDGLLKRTVLPEVPPHVEYKLTEKGASLESILCDMDIWAKKHVIPEMK